MKYRIISVGKIKEPFYRQGVNEYMKRLKSYGQFELIDGLEERLDPEPAPKDIEHMLQKEAGKILNLLRPDELVVALDIEGKNPDSRQLADLVRQWNESGRPRVNFVIGASYGLSPDMKQRADYRLSFSSLTFAHQLAVLMLVEQLYRSFRILHHEPYHK
ncbi:MAG: 23S rRNA (pseudouridine(1915)-N(3))-methyltransferase RlmH [Syntrophomonadaceae bacterium]|nr:23S rRNA (pseudouridine(1915)-N(3))-methyltransferase RlmH [Syntrophomonadaceae bacterium]